MTVQLPLPKTKQLQTNNKTYNFFHFINTQTQLPSFLLSSSLPTLCCLFAPHTHTHTLSPFPNSPNFQIEHLLPPSSYCSLPFLLPHFQTLLGLLSWVLLLLHCGWAGFCVVLDKKKGRKIEAFAMGRLPFLLSALWVLLFLTLAPFSPARGARISPAMAPFFGIALPPTAGIGNAPLTYAPMGLAPFGSIAAEGRPHHHHLNKGLILAGVLVSSMATLLVITCFCVWIGRRANVQKTNPKDAGKRLTLNPILGKLGSLKANGKKGTLSVIEYSLLEMATNRFSDKNLLGEGGFGCVYKACFDANVFTAVKKINCCESQSEKQFENEIDLMGRIRHPNIVSLFGYCVHGQTRFLVSELMQNGSLETQLHGPSHGMSLTWHLRMKIALDTARGLECLHEHCNPPIIHRDLKSSNILLDSNFNAKLSDFGIATTSGGQSNNSVKLCGTLGYVAPEYLLDGKLTEKSDVYAFGVILLELLIGRKPVEKMNSAQCQSIVTWAMPQLTDRSKLPTIVDPVIRNTMDLKHLYQVAAVAVLCVQPEPSYRPLITDVLHSLIPLVPINLGGALRISDNASHMDLKSAS